MNEESLQRFLAWIPPAQQWIPISDGISETRQRVKDVLLELVKKFEKEMNNDD